MWLNLSGAGVQTNERALLCAPNCERALASSSGACTAVSLCTGWKGMLLPNYLEDHLKLPPILSLLITTFEVTPYDWSPLTYPIPA